jgi:hypothetical protein
MDLDGYISNLSRLKSSVKITLHLREPPAIV